MQYNRTMPYLQHADNCGRQSRVLVCTNDQRVHEKKTHCTR